MIWEIVIGLETHVELSTKSKLFCACATTFGAPPNSLCCPVCTGLPGTLPVLNKEAVEYAVKAALAFGCEITRHCRFDRKHYFYPDLPKAYQISQRYLPLAQHGSLTLKSGKAIRIHDIHIEEDAGKLTHKGAITRADYNRCGIPLIEIVTEPDVRSAEEAVEYLTQLKEMCQYLGISDCKMQEGSLRCDVNLSVRPMGHNTLGERTEMKNLGSFRAISRAIAYEAKRQIDVMEQGGQVIQETRRWDEERNRSVTMRTKEDAADYRYFPEPDIPPLSLSAAELTRIGATLPELAAEKRLRYQRDYCLSEYDAEQLTGEKALAEFYEAVIDQGTRPKEAANWIMGQVLRKLSEQAMPCKEMPLQAKTLSRLIQLVESGQLNRSMAIKVFDAVFNGDGDVDAYVKEHELYSVSDVETVRTVAGAVLVEHRKSVRDYRAGKEKSFGFLVGQVMRRLGGKAAPKLVNEVLNELLDKHTADP